MTRSKHDCHSCFGHYGCRFVHLVGWGVSELLASAEGGAVGHATYQFNQRWVSGRGHANERLNQSHRIRPQLCLRTRTTDCETSQAPGVPAPQQKLLRKTTRQYLYHRLPQNCIPNT